jgi:hypothetical protein
LLAISLHWRAIRRFGKSGDTASCAQAAAHRIETQAAPDAAALEPALLAGFEDSADDALVDSAGLDAAAPSVPDAPPSEPAAAEFVAPAPLALLLLLLLLPPRKSVTYQPEPFSWKPAAVTCLEKVSFPQAGHCVSGASLNFRSTSFSWPQESQRYA